MNYPGGVKNNHHSLRKSERDDVVAAAVRDGAAGRQVPTTEWAVAIGCRSAPQVPVARHENWGHRSLGKRKESPGRSATLDI